MEMEWKSFKDEIPEHGKWILYGNHRIVDTLKFSIKDRFREGELKAFLPITHWCYIDLPPQEP